MDRLILQSTMLFGPVYGLLLIGIYVARLRFSETHILFEMTEPILAVFAAILAIAASGVWIQVVG